MSAPRVVIVHDYLTQRGGAERVVLAMAEAFPDAPVVTALYEPDATFPEFSGVDVRPLPLDRLAPLRTRHRYALPLLAPAFSRHEIADADVVLCSTSGWAHGVRTTAPKLAYCYTPARWLYLPDDYLAGAGRATRAGLAALRPALLRWDQRAARTVTSFRTSSTVVVERIRATYGVDAGLLPPPVPIEVAGPHEPVPGVEPGFFLVVARPRSYKNVELVAAAVAATPGARLVAVGGLPAGDWPDRLRGVADIPDAQLRWLYAHCAGVIAAAHEDFGLTPVEGFAYGRPALALRAGGYLDTVVEGVTGAFFGEPTVPALSAALTAFDPAAYDEAAIRAHAARYSRDRFVASLRDWVAAYAA